jgi:hypothetical protein
LPSALQVLLRTREIREALGLLIPEFLDLWAGDHPLKKKAARPLGRSFQKGLQQPSTRGGGPTGLGEVMPEMVDRLFATLQAAVDKTATLAPEEKQKHLDALGASLAAGQAGRLFTRALQSLHDLHQTHPTALADAIAPAIRSWVEHTDFGALRDLADTMQPEARALAGEINALLWQYPSKLVLSLSFLPDLLNLAVIFLQETLRRFNQAAPDLVADIALSLVRSVDGRSLGAVLNELTALIRKIHTGSALIGDPGRPGFQDDMQQMMTAIVGELDSHGYWSARIALQEDKEIVVRSLSEALADRPEVVSEGLRTYAARKNPGLRAGRLRLEALEQISDDALRQVLDDGLSDLDLQAWSDSVNLACGLVNRVTALKPELIPYLAQQLSASLDVDEIETAGRDALKASGGAFRPLLRGLLPDIIVQLSRALAPAEDEYEAKVARARKHLRSLLMDQEVVS